KGTGNMELVLDRRLSDRRIFPAMDITQSGTRKEERILPADVLQRVVLLRRSLVSLNPVQAMESLVKKLAEYPSKAALLERRGGCVWYCYSRPGRFGRVRRAFTYLSQRYRRCPTPCSKRSSS